MQDGDKSDFSEEEDNNNENEEESESKMSVDEEDEESEEKTDEEYKHQQFHFDFPKFKYSYVFEGLEYLNNEGMLSDFCDHKRNEKERTIKILPYDEIYANKVNLIKEEYFN